MAHKYVFGPVMSGRLGRSLGLDLLGDRICSMDCIYCEVGATHRLTQERAPYVPAADVLAELKAWKEEGHTPPDMVTLGGLGEPCLNSEMVDVIASARSLFPGTDIAVLTNATALTDAAVRTELAQADVVLPSMDSLVEDEFQRINRPADGITADNVAEALLAFREVFKGKIFLEILLIEGVNDSDANLEKLTEFCRRLSPDRVDVVTTSRPGTIRDAHPVSGEVLSRWRMELESGKPEACCSAAQDAEAIPAERLVPLIEASLSRRPQTVPQLAKALNANSDAVRQAVEVLVSSGDVIPREDRGEIFYHGKGHDFGS